MCLPVLSLYLLSTNQIGNVYILMIFKTFLPTLISGFIIFGLGTDLYMTLRGKGFKRLSESAWREWIDAPDRRRGRVGRIIEIASAARTISECEAIFEAIRLKELSPIRRSLLLMRTCVGAAPLLGLLGTVTGIISTFKLITVFGTGDVKTLSGGISEDSSGKSPGKFR